QSAILKAEGEKEAAIKKAEGEAEAIARGLAVGVFAGCFPFFGLQSLIALFLATFCRGNKLAAVLGTWVSNPLTYLPIFAFNFKVGQLFFGQQNLVLQDLMQDLHGLLFQSGLKFALTIFSGSFVVGITAAAITYWLSLKFIVRWRQDRNKQAKKYTKPTSQRY
ncbi:MAG: DUF2062 domain-containing protein, partial [Cyanobacteria bacterium J083]